ncbi:unnamed protein product [Spirodela intermedia]|uniref:Reverse transcriptase Ty1/copia-type domain-containing protein n=1 Tax=Spirodela intermedia TaxID=51605 RepID=A0A7I8J231_SPIIN|nr:unnamed protein product [Spirodela intermedia]CAA6663370.1 unnamed protein product [Spirodela intermedia]
MTILIVNVDDILITGDDTNEIQNLSKNLSQEFDIKSLGRLRYFLGIEVAHLREETGQLTCKPIVILVDINVKLEAGGDSPPVNKESFQRLIGKLIYLNHSKSDVAYAVKKIHLQAAYCILAYLKNIVIVGQCLLFSRGGDSTVEIYSDVDYAGSVHDRRSSSGYCSFISGNLVSWRKKKQKVVSRSSVEAQFRAMAQGICEAIGLLCTPYVSTHNQVTDVLNKRLSSEYCIRAENRRCLFTSLRGSVGKKV